MPTLEALRRQMDSTESLHTVVRTMKVLSMTSIHQCEEAVESLNHYAKTVRQGLHIALRHRPHRVPQTDVAPHAPMGALVFGSIWGMCGRFNEQLAEDVAADLRARDTSDIAVMTFGEYIGGALESNGWTPDHTEGGPESVEGITRHVQDELVHLERWRERDHRRRIVLFYNELQSGTRYSIRVQPLLPLDRDWLRAIEQQTWPTRQVPTFRLPWDALFTALLQQYLFGSVYRAFAESLASEHSSRLAAMQRAETNVEDRLDRLHSQFHRQRQTAITEEVLDITAGYTAAQGHR